jgi:uncharacterized BrkB/YihY/UPF0761 family membrane protein
MRTEVHVHAFSVAANVLLAFFPFLIVTNSLSSIFFNQYTTLAAIDLALRDYFPSELGQFLKNNLPPWRPWQAPQIISVGLLLFTSNGIFEPLEVALNHIWGIHKNRSFLRNQLVSLALIFSCGGLALFSLWLGALGRRDGRVTAVVAALFFKLASVPIMVLILFLVYRFLPNGKPPLSRIVPAAIGVGLLFEVLKLVNSIFWPRVETKIMHEYGVFSHSVTIIFLGFLSSMLFLAGAEWAARGHRMDREAGPQPAKEPAKGEN